MPKIQYEDKTMQYHATSWLGNLLPLFPHELLLTLSSNLAKACVLKATTLHRHVFFNFT
jgi:hypothetical protein